MIPRPVSWLLAQAEAVDPELRGEAAQRIWQAIGWGLLILVVAVTMLVVAMWVKRQILGRPIPGDREGIGFTLSDLRQMQREGKISQQEYELTRDRIVQAAQRAIAEASADDRPALSTPQPKNIDLIRDAER